MAAAKMQMANECFNSLVWKRVPKAVYVAHLTFKLGVYNIQTWRIGCCHSIQYWGKSIGVRFRKFRNDSRTVHGQRFRFQKPEVSLQYVAAEKSSDVTKKRRKVLRGQKKKKADNQKEKEGSVYKAGGF